MGNPAFSKFGRMRNFDYIALSPVKEPKIPNYDVEGPIVDQINSKFKIKPEPTIGQ